jgi:hypothetical protein
MEVSHRETRFKEINQINVDLLEADFWPASSLADFQVARDSGEIGLHADVYCILAVPGLCSEW